MGWDAGTGEPAVRASSQRASPPSPHGRHQGLGEGEENTAGTDHHSLFPSLPFETYSLHSNNVIELEVFSRARGDQEDGWILTTG